MKELKRAMFIAMLAFVGWSCGDDDGDVTPTPDPEPPSAPSGVSTADVTTEGFTVNWSAVTGAASYGVQISSDNGFGTIVTDQSGITTTSAAVTGLTSATEYFVRVNATNSDGTSDYSSTASVTTEAEADPGPDPEPDPGPDPGPDPTPGNAATIGGAVFEPTTNEAKTANGITQLLFSDGTATITITTNASAAGTYTIASTGDHTATYQNGDSVFVATSGTLEVTAVSPTMSGTYEFEADFSFVNGRTLDIVSITGGSFIDIVISAADPIDSPVAGDATDVTDTGFTANWGVVSGALSYFLDVASDDGFTTLVVDNQAVLGTSFAVSNLTANGNYYFRVRATNVLTTSDNSNVSTATTTGGTDPGPDPGPGSLGDYIIKQTDTTADGVTVSEITYDDNCNVTTVVGTGVSDFTSTFVYNSDGLLSTITTVATAPAASTSTITIAGYNSANLPTGVTISVLGFDFTWSFTYDAQGRLTQSVNDLGFAGSTTYTYTYDGDNVSTVEQSGAISGTYTFEYTSEGKNIASEQVDNGTYNWANIGYRPTFLSKNLISKETFVSGGTTTVTDFEYTLNADEYPTQIKTTGGSTTTLDIEYGSCN